MNLLNLCTIASAEWTGFGLTAADWVALLTLAGTLIATLIKLIRVIDKLSSQLDDLHRSNENLNKQYRDLSEHLQRHDRQFIKDEMRLEELRREIGGKINDPKN